VKSDVPRKKPRPVRKPRGKRTKLSGRMRALFKACKLTPDQLAMVDKAALAWLAQFYRLGHPEDANDSEFDAVRAWFLGATLNYNMMAAVADCRLWVEFEDDEPATICETGPGERQFLQSAVAAVEKSAAVDPGGVMSPEQLRVLIEPFRKEAKRLRLRKFPEEAPGKDS
jgi:hypothetical protein